STLDGAPPPDPDVSVEVRVITPAFLPTLGTPVLQGRGFTEEDGDASPRVVLVSETAARLLWPGEDPLGRRLELGTQMGLGRGRIGGEVVGVVRDVKGQSPAEAP